MQKSNTDIDRCELSKLLRCSWLEIIEFFNENCKYYELEKGINLKGGEKLFIPNIDILTYEKFLKIRSLESVDALLAYLWKMRNYLKHFDTKKEYENLNHWEFDVLFEIVLYAIHDLIHKNSIYQHKRNSSHDKFIIDETLLNEDIKTAVKFVTEGTRRCTVKIPLTNVDIISDRYEISENIVIKKWIDPELSYDRSYHSYGFTPFYNSLQWCKSCIEIYYDLEFEEKNIYDTVTKNILKILPIIKYAIFKSTNFTSRIIEGPILITAHLQRLRFHPIRRHQNNLQSERVTINNETQKLIEKTLKDIHNVIKFCSKIDRGIQMLDRAMLSIEYVDSIVNSVIGIESIIVPNAGENLRRFKVYGATLLAFDGYEETTKNLKEIYNIRSGFAHKGDNDADKKFSIISMLYLAKIIDRCTWLYMSNKIDKPTKKFTLPHNIEKFLNDLLYLKFQHVLNEQ